jgi:hypothetical protein
MQSNEIAILVHLFLISEIHLTRYFTRYLGLKNAVHKKDVPPFFDSWCDKTFDACIYTKEQLKRWSLAHLRGGV